MFNRKYIEDIFQASRQYRQSNILHLKRAAIVASYDVVECVLHNRHAGSDTRQLNTFGSVSYLHSISSMSSTSRSNESFDALLLDILQWAMACTEKEPDPQCRAFLSQILLLSIDNVDRK